MNAIHLTELGKRFNALRGKPQWAVKNLSLSVAQGEAFGFIGANGAGKSTTIKILTGAIKPDTGTAQLFGVDCWQPSARRQVAYVPESPYLPDYLTPKEVLSVGMDVHGLPAASRKKALDEWLGRFGIDHVANKVIKTFSKGMVQRVVLAHAMVVAPRLLILDEPLSGLDPLGRRDVVDILAEYRRQGGAIFFSSHVLHDVERLADRFGLIHQGELLVVKSPSELSIESSQFTVRSQGECVLVGFHQDTGFRWSATVMGDQLWATLEALNAAGHKVIEIKPQLSIETLFFKLVNQKNPESKR
jgi:ABC-2 type transport system ATP-binding protein